MTQRLGERLEGPMEGLTLFALGVTLTSGMLLGSGSSPVARGVFLILAATTLLLSSMAMMIQGRWRIVRSSLWIAAAAWIALLALQILPAVSQHLPEPLRPKEPGAISLERSATLQSLVWSVGGVAVLLVASAHIRSGARFSATVAALSIALWGIGLIGFAQTILDRPQLLGLVELDDSRLPSIVRDLFGYDAAHGQVAYQAWEPTTTAEVTFFAPPAGRIRLFGGFLDPRHWGACVAILLPMLMASCVYYGSFAGVGGMRTHGRSQQSWIFWVIGLCMACTAAWMADPVTLPAILTVSLVVVVLFIGRQDRSHACGLGMLYLLVMGGLCAAYWYVRGTPPFLVRLEEWSRQCRPLLQHVPQRLWGTGVATSADLGEPSAQLLSTSSLGALAMEAGLVGVGIAAFACLVVLLRTAWIYRRLDRDGRIALAGTLGSLVAWGLVSLVGPGVDVPVACALALLSMGCLMRTLAVGLRDEEALLAV